MKTLLTLIAVLCLIASMGAPAETGPYTLVLITPGRHFKAQLGTFDSLRECTNEGAKILTDQDIYVGFGCVIVGT